MSVNAIQCHQIIMYITFSRSGSSKARARLLLSITEDAATSSGVEPLMAGQAVERTNLL